MARQGVTWLARSPDVRADQRRICAQRHELVRSEQTAIDQRPACRRQLPAERAVVKRDRLGHLAGGIFPRASNIGSRKQVTYRTVTGEIAAEDFPRYSAPILLRNGNAQRKRRRKVR